MPRKKSEKSEEKKVKETKAKEPIEKKIETDVEGKVIELAKKGLTPEKIGLELKKQGIFVKKATGQRISHLLKEKGIEMNADLLNLTRHVEKLKKHLSIHKHDFKSKRSLLIREANLNKIKKINS
jgi:ribosomal protein S15P/S13E